MNKKSKKIKITRSSNTDTRTAKGNVAKNGLLVHTKLHKKDVKAMLNYCASILKHKGKCHDYTKIEYIDDFHSDFKEARNENKEFKNLNWYKTHVETERHHLNSRCPEDVDVFDLLEMICDCVAAGLARNGEYYPISVDNTILEKVVKNTANKLLAVCEIKR